MATSLTALAISPAARPASSDVAAICCEAALRLDAVWLVLPTSSFRFAVIATNACPSASRSERGCTVAVRSPSAIRRAAAADSRR